MNVSQSLAALLRIEAQLDALKETRAQLRAAVEDEARRAYVDTGAAPTYRVTGVGTASLSGADSWAPTVRDPRTFTGWAIEHYPTEVEVLYRVPASAPAEVRARFDAAFDRGGPTPSGVRSEFDVRASLIKKLAEAAPIIAERADANGDHPLVAEGGEIVPGVVMRRSEARLAIRFNADTRRELTARELAAAAALAPVDDEASDDPPDREQNPAVVIEGPQNCTFVE